MQSIGEVLENGGNMMGNISCEKNQSLDTQMEIIELQKKKIDRQEKQIEKLNHQIDQQNIQLTNIIENLSEGVTFADNKGNYTMVNSEAKRMLYRASEGLILDDAFKNIKLFDLMGNELPYKNYPSFRALRGESVKNVRLFVNRPDKEYYVEVSVIPIYNDNGELTIVVSYFHDITEEIKQSRKIEQQKKQLEAIIENIAYGICIIDNNGENILCNKASRKIYSPMYNSPHEICHGCVRCKRELYDIDDLIIDPQNVPSRRVIRGEKFENMRAIVKHPHKTYEVEVSGTPIYDSEGNVVLGVLCSRDMTDYYKREQSITSRFEILDRIINSFNLPVARLSCPDLLIIDINKKAFEFLKLIRPDVKSVNKFINSKIEDLFSTLKESEYYQCISEVLKEKKTQCLSKENHLVNGKEMYWNVIFEPVFSVDGEIEEILILIIDVTTEIEAAIDMEKALKSQGEFLVNISHELKTPLNVIFATAQLFNMYCTNGSMDEKKDSIIKYIDSIKQNSYRLSKMINNIVDLSKIEAGFFELNLSNINIVEFVEDIVMSVTNFTDSKGLNIIFDTNIEEKIIACDPEKMERVVLNLISNAIKFTDKGDEILVYVKDDNEFVEISVSDNGIGIKSEYLDMIFDRFKQVDRSLSRNAEGTGIGLSLVKSIVELHGGSIYVESEFGKGSKFIVKLSSAIVTHPNMLYNSRVTSGDQSMRVEFSDVYS